MQLVLRRVLSGLAIVPLILAALVNAPAQALGGACDSEGVSVDPMHKANRPFYVSTSGGLYSGSVGWSFAGTPITDAGTNLWVKLDNFSDPSKLDLNSSQPAAFAVLGHTESNLPLGYAYLTSTGATTAAQTWRVSVYHGNPALSGSTLICTYSDGVSKIHDNITAAANKPDTVKIIGTPTLGRTFTMEVKGSTGTIGAGVAGSGDSYVVGLSPSMGNSWPAGSFQLVGVTTSFGSGGIATTDDYLRTNFSSADNSNRNYTTNYTFLVRKPVDTPTNPVPRTSIASGTQVKISDPAVTSDIIPATIDPVSAGTLTQNITSTTDWGTNQTEYSVTYTNTGSEVCFDELTVTPTDPSGWSYVTGSTTLDGVPGDDPSVSDTALTFDAFCVPANGTTEVKFTVSFTSVVSLEVSGNIGGSTITSGGSTGQAITFDALEDKTLSQGPVTVSATATSGLPVSFESLTTDVCTVSGTSVTLVSTGTCTLRASQEGDATYGAAQPVDQSFTVSPNPTASLSVHVSSATFGEDYDGVEVSVAKDGGAFAYRTGVTDANGDLDLGDVDPNSEYQVTLKAPCDNRPVETKSVFSVTTGAVAKDYTLAATVPCAPSMAYNSGADRLSWTEPNDGGSHIRYYTYQYTTQDRINKGQPWGIFARQWPADISEVPFGTYAQSGCPARSVAVSPLPYNKNPQCLRPFGAPRRGKPYQYRVAARNAVVSAGVVSPNGAGWSAYSDIAHGTRP